MVRTFCFVFFSALPPILCNLVEKLNLIFICIIIAKNLNSFVFSVVNLGEETCFSF